MFLSREPVLAMMLSLYVTLGIFLLLAVRNPSANRSLIGFTAWSSFAHAAVMGVQAGISENDRTRRTAGSGCAGCHRCGPDRTGSGEGVSRADIGSRGVTRAGGKLILVARTTSQISAGCPRRRFHAWVPPRKASKPACANSLSSVNAA